MSPAPDDPSDDGWTRDPAAVAATWCATLVDEWIRAGITDAVVSPGSRSTPMALALAARAELAVHVHHDERAAGFTALGLGLASGRPALVLTTSGTAAVELHPAVVEAHQAGVPLIVLTADRPPELHDVGAAQTVDQQHLFGRAVRWFTDPGVADADAAWSWRSVAARAVAEATTGPAGPGPVHVNLPFREPLVGPAGPLPPGRAHGAPWHSTVRRRPAVDDVGINHLASLLTGERGVVVAGAGAGDPEVVLALARATGWPVLADPRSGCRVDGAEVVAAADAILRHPRAAAALRPDVVLRLGAPPASKVLNAWLATSGARQVAVDGHGTWYDADRTAGHVVHADPTAVASALAGLLASPVDDRRGASSDAPSPSSADPESGGANGRRPTGHPMGMWSQRWQAAEQAAQTAISEVLARRPEATEPGIARTVAGSLPAGSTLVVSSSMPVRDVEWYGAPRSGLRVLANRGANGIDGVISTAVGVALAARGTGAATAVLVGDVALLHDSNALLGILGRGIDLTVVVVDNDGGGIFSFLPQATALPRDRFELLFGTPHGVDLRVLAAAHGLTTVEPAGAADVATAMTVATATGGVHLVRIATDRSTNVAVHDEIHAAVAGRLDDLAGLRG